MALINCVKCGKEYSNTLKTCPACNYTPVYSYCPECKTIVKLDDKSCKNCGFLLTGVELPHANLEDVKKEAESLFTKFEENKENKDALLSLLTEMEFYLNLDEVQQLKADITAILAEFEALEKKMNAYKDLVNKFDTATTSEQFKKLEDEFNAYGDFEDASNYVTLCQEKYTETLYNEACVLVSRNTKNDLNRALVVFEGIKEYGDTNQKIADVQNRLAEMSKKAKNTVKLLVAAAVVAICAFLVVTCVIVPGNKYKEAVAAMDSKNYEQAVTLFTELGNYKDAAEYAVKAQEEMNKIVYAQAQTYMNNGQFVDAANELNKIQGYMDSSDLIFTCGEELVKNAKYSDAIDVFELVPDHATSSTYIDYCEGVVLFTTGNYEGAKTQLQKVSTFMDANTYINTCNNIFKLEEAEEYWAKGYLNSAKAIYDKLPKDFEHNGVSVSKRLSLLKKNSKFLNLCGKWKSTGGKMTVRQIHDSTGLWDEWYLNKLKGYTFEITCKISDSGKVTVNVDGSIPRYTSYSSLSAYLTQGNVYFDKTYTASKLPSGKKIASYTKMTYKNGKITINYKYTDRNESVYFTYRYTSNLYYKRSTKY